MMKKVKKKMKKKVIKTEIAVHAVVIYFEKI